MPRQTRPLARRKEHPKDAAVHGLKQEPLRRTLLSQDDIEENISDISEGSAYEVVHAIDDDEDSVDAPRVVQWADEGDFKELDTDDEHEGGLSNSGALQRDLSDLPLGALRKAQKILAYAEVDYSESSDGESEEGVPTSLLSSKGKERDKPEWNAEPRKSIARRAHKHAPIEVTSKRPVTRKRTVVDVPTLKPRDPRFLPLAGEFSADQFQRSYSFLAQKHQKELETLRENLKRARKLLSSSPRDTYQERADEVERLELAVKRAESLVNKDRRDTFEQDALDKMNKEEREKRKQGKGTWYLKKANKRELLTKARYEAIALEGGSRAVKKVIEKKQRKIGQKEKKSRPYSKGGDGEGDGGRNKRRRVV